MLKSQLIRLWNTRALNIRVLPTVPGRSYLRINQATKRYTSTDAPAESQDNTEGTAGSKQQEAEGKDVSLVTEKAKDDPVFVPWYLRMTQGEAQGQQKPIQSNTQPLTFPDNSPQSLVKIAEFLRDKEGLTEILIFDVRSSDESTIGKMADFVVVSTARSRKHAESVFSNLNQFVKQEFGRVVYMEGNIDMNHERKAQRRLRRRASLGTSRRNVRSNRDIGRYQLDECWLMLDTHVDRIFINILTAERRYELNLEELYAPEEEKEKYARVNAPEVLGEDSTDGLTDITKENNILSGLRRLASQRRYYSTERTVNDPTQEGTYTGELVSKLIQRDFASIYNMVDREELQNSQELPPDSSKQLSVLKSIVDTLGSMVASEANNIDVDSWRGVFDLHWPLYMPEDSNAYWRIRMRFLRLLNVAQPTVYHSRRLIKDYFILKQAFAEQLTKQDLIDLLELVKTNSSLGPTNGNDSEKLKLSVNNRVISDVLEQYIGSNLEETILVDNNVLYLLLECLVKEPEAALETLYETVEFIGTSWGPHLTLDTVSIILSVLTDAKEWHKLLKFWKTVLPLSQHRADPSLWSQFLQAIKSSDDDAFIEQIVIDGTLVWMQRYGVEITEEIRKHLLDLYARVYPTDEAARQLGLFLLNEK